MRRSQGLSLVMVARRATVNRGRHPLRLAPDLDSEQLGVTERLAAGTAAEARLDDLLLERLLRLSAVFIACAVVIAFF